MVDRLEPLILPDEARSNIPDGTVSTPSYRATWTDLSQEHSCVVFTPPPHCEQIFPAEYEGHFESLMISRAEILDRVQELALLIHEDYINERLVMVCVLKGANPVSYHDVGCDWVRYTDKKLTAPIVLPASTGSFTRVETWVYDWILTGIVVRGHRVHRPCDS